LHIAHGLVAEVVRFLNGFGFRKSQYFQVKDLSTGFMGQSSWQEVTVSSNIREDGRCRHYLNSCQCQCCERHFTSNLSISWT